MQIVCHTGGLTVTGLKLLNQQLLPQSWCPCSDACGRRPQWDLVMKSRRIFGKLKTCFEDFRSTWMQHEIYWRSTGDLLEIWYAALFGLSLGRFHRSPLCRTIFLAGKLRRPKWLCCKHETYQTVPPCAVFVVQDGAPQWCLLVYKPH